MIAMCPLVPGRGPWWRSWAAPAPPQGGRSQVGGELAAGYAGGMSDPTLGQLAYELLTSNAPLLVGEHAPWDALPDELRRAWQTMATQLGPEAMRRSVAARLPGDPQPPLLPEPTTPEQWRVWTAEVALSELLSRQVVPLRLLVSQRPLAGTDMEAAGFAGQSKTPGRYAWAQCGRDNANRKWLVRLEGSPWGPTWRVFVHTTNDTPEGELFAPLPAP